jgi:hypothetical protein
VWLPPEVYLDLDLAIRESARWRSSLRIPLQPPELSPGAKSLHLIQTEFPEPWRACPVWVGVSWSERSYPRMRIEPMAADESEAAAWLRKRTPKGMATDKPGQLEFQRRGVRTSAGVFRMKRVMGF